MAVLVVLSGECAFEVQLFLWSYFASVWFFLMVNYSVCMFSSLCKITNQPYTMWFWIAIILVVLGSKLGFELWWFWWFC